MTSRFEKRPSQYSGVDEVVECKKKRFGFGYNLSDKMWILRNFAPKIGEKVSADEILEMYSKDHGEASRKLPRHSLGRIIQDLWRGSVRLARLGKRGEQCQKYYLNLGKVLRTLNAEGSDIIQNGVDMTDPDAVLNSLYKLELPRNWIKIKNSETSLSFLRLEKWAVNGQRMVTELKITKEESDFRIEISSQGVTLNVMDTNLGYNEMTDLKLEERLQLLIKCLDNSETGICSGFPLPASQDSLALLTSHRIVEVSYFDESSQTSKKCVFSGKCKLISSPGQCCSSCSHLKKLEALKQSKISSMGNDFKLRCNERYLSRKQLKNKISSLRKDLRSATTRENRLREKYEVQQHVNQMKDLPTDLGSSMDMNQGGGYNRDGQYGV